MPASAWVGVGAAPTCEARTVQAAINTIMARQRKGDFADPHIVLAAGSYNEAAIIDGRDINGHVVTITGGYKADCSGPQAGASSTLNALHRSGSALTIRGAISVALDSLTITGANTGGNGGGIYFDGSGQLDATRVQLVNNHAGRGGGLFANGTAAGLVVRLHGQTDVQSNVAQHSGGGIRVQGNTRLYMLDGNGVYFNQVNPNDNDGAGGGIQVVGPARADLGSVSVLGNSARYGGGLSVDIDNNQLSNVRFFTTISNLPTHIDNNGATRTGGGIFVAGGGRVCGMGSISQNQAQDGAGIYVDVAGDVLFTDGPPPGCGSESTASLGALSCAEGVPCTSVNDNRAVAIDNADTPPTDGAAVLVQSIGGFDATRVEMRRNRGKYVVRGFETLVGSDVNLGTCLLVDNRTTGDLIRMEESGRLRMSHCTVAGNQISGANILSLTGDLSLTKSLLWQLNTTTLAQSNGHVRDVSNVIASEIQSIGGVLGFGAGVTLLPLQFVDSAAGDYHLLPNTPGQDFAPADETGTDLDDHARVVDLPIADRVGGGPVDLGAYEVQSLSNFPMVENFDHITAPALPFGWNSVVPSQNAGWVTRATGAASAPNAAFTDDPALVVDRFLESPAVAIVSKGQLRFRHKFDLEAVSGTFASDGVVLEIAIGNAAFVDLFQAGGSAVSGAYDHTIAFFAPGNNPLRGRGVWSGSTQGLYKDVVVNLPASADGKSVRLRWRLGTDNSNTAAHAGYWLDDIHVDVNTSLR